MRSNRQKGHIHLRRAERADAEMVFKWRNDPYLVARGSSQRVVTWTEHQKWFEENELSDYRVMFIIQKESLPVGQIRFDRLNQATGVISVYLLEEFTHKGYGVLAIRHGCQEIFSLWDIQKVVARVRQDNLAARGAFIKAGFFETDRRMDGLESHYTMTLSRSNVDQSQGEKKSTTENVWSEDHKKNIDYYSRLILEHGISVQSLDWGSVESQQLRFSILAKIGELNNASVLDVGCGLGDFLDWLKNLKMEMRYTGLDITPHMIQFAKKRFPNTCFIIGNLLELDDSVIGHHDYIFASGIFARIEKIPFRFMQEMVLKMFSLCNKAVGFNSLSEWAPQKDSGEYYADPLEVLNFCRTITPWVVLRHDYHARDFTVYMYKRR
ncbi:MAG: GNAT family N-acetyltransferase [Deltaproteobacteria bacterium]|nr:GNAT family N-acetyltransferase [Deltaproteobacteria bacterium]